MTDAKMPAPEASSDKMTTLKFYVDLANSEKQAIWARHATMVVGNALMINAAKQQEPDYFFGVAGLALCVIWAFMTYDGWGWFYKPMLESRRLVSDPLLNPFMNYPELAKRRSDGIFICTLLVISIFSSVYIHIIFS